MRTICNSALAIETEGLSCDMKLSWIWILFVLTSYVLGRERDQWTVAQVGCHETSVCTFDRIVCDIVVVGSSIPEAPVYRITNTTDSSFKIIRTAAVDPVTEQVQRIIGCAEDGPASSSDCRPLAQQLSADEATHAIVIYFDQDTNQPNLSWDMVNASVALHPPLDGNTTFQWISPQQLKFSNEPFFQAMLDGTATLNTRDLEQWYRFSVPLKFRVMRPGTVNAELLLDGLSATGATWSSEFNFSTCGDDAEVIDQFVQRASPDPISLPKSV